MLYALFTEGSPHENQASKIKSLLLLTLSSSLSYLSPFSSVPSFPTLSLSSFFPSSPSSCEQQLVSRHGSPLSLQECEELVSSLQEKYPAEYKTYDLSSVAVAIVFPMIKAFLQVTVVLYP